MMKRILIVDDEPLIRHSLAAGLRQDDTTVKVVSSGADALAEIERFFYHLCFLDIHLPDMNGLDIMKTIKKLSPATKIVIMTASEVDADMLKSMQENANLLVAKPFDLDRIKLFVDRTMGQGAFIHLAGAHSFNWIKRETFENWLVDDKRLSERQTVMHNTICSVVASDRGRGEQSFTVGIIEIGDAGMCIRTNYPLKPGQLLTFGVDPVLSTGVVRWSKSKEGEDAFHAGIQFVMPENAPSCSP